MMEMKGRDRNSVSTAQQVKSLNQRWFLKKDESIETCSGDDASEEYRRGSIVTLSGKSHKYLVCAVFDKYYNKFYMRSWSLEQQKKKKIERLLLRRIYIDRSRSGISSAYYWKPPETAADHTDDVGMVKVAQVVSKVGFLSAQN
jgi:hypothetical protein